MWSDILWHTVYYNIVPGIPQWYVIYRQNHLHWVQYPLFQPWMFREFNFSVHPGLSGSQCHVHWVQSSWTDSNKDMHMVAYISCDYNYYSRHTLKCWSPVWHQSSHVSTCIYMCMLISTMKATMYVVTDSLSNSQPVWPNTTDLPPDYHVGKLSINIEVWLTLLTLWGTTALRSACMMNRQGLTGLRVSDCNLILRPPSWPRFWLWDTVIRL